LIVLFVCEFVVCPLYNQLQMYIKRLRIRCVVFVFVFVIHFSKVW